MRKIYQIMLAVLCVSIYSSVMSGQCCHGDEFVERCSDCDDTRCFASKTFMMTRPLVNNVRVEQSLWHDFLYDKKENGGSFKITALYQQSMETPETAKYFTFNYKTLLRVMGDEAYDACFRDIRAEWLGLPSDFRGSFSLSPKQRQYGCVLTYNQDIKQFISHDFLQRFWVEFSLPLVVVENSLQLCQCDVMNKGQECPMDIIQAFNQPSWQYGKINGAFSCFNLAPLRARVGGAFLSRKNDQIVSYTVLSFPTGRHDCNHYLFEPVADYNGHLGFGGGVNFQFALNRCENTVYDLCFFLNFESLFLIRRWHCRTFDLKCRPSGDECPCNVTCAPCEYRKRPWSRYLPFNTKNGVPNQNVPGVNVLTRRVKVRPYGMYDFSFGLRLISKEKCEIEVGYGIWGHGSERIECIEKFQKQWGISGNKSGDVAVRSASMSTICQRIYASDEEERGETFIPICATDLDLDSAASQGALNHIFNIAGGFEHTGKHFDGFIGGGAYYEIPQKNSALQTWGIWITFGGTF